MRFSHLCDVCFLLSFYKKKTGIFSKLVVCGMTTNSLNLVDPDDGGVLEVCGFDSHTADVIRDFITDVIWGRCTMGNAPQRAKLHRKKNKARNEMCTWFCPPITSSWLDKDCSRNFIRYGALKQELCVRFYKNIYFWYWGITACSHVTIGCSVFLAEC